MSHSTRHEWLPSCVLVLLLFLGHGVSGQRILLRDEHGNLRAINPETKSYFVANQVLLKVKPGVLDSALLSSPALEFATTLLNRVVKNDSLRKMLTKTGALKLRRVVPHLRPQHLTLKTGNKSGRVADLCNLLVVDLLPNADVLATCAALAALGGVEYAQPNYFCVAADTPPNDTYYSQQLGFNQSSLVDIRANHAWDYTVGSYGVKVGVVDSGIDYNNPDLGNGAFGSGAKVSSGYNYVDNNSNPLETTQVGHGTACAGIIGAQRNNSVGVAGLAGGNAAVGNVGCQLVALKVGDGATYPTDKVIAAITEGSAKAPGYGFGCQVLNNSYTTSTYSAALENAVAVAAQNNTVFVASSGNGTASNKQGQVVATYPANFSSAWTIAVGASDGYDQRATFSNYGNDLAVVAPGTSGLVYTTFSASSGSAYGNFNGTSAAAPHVAGVAALLLSVNSSLHPQDVDGIIKASADKVSGRNGANYTYPNGYNQEMGYGRLNAGKALEMMQSPWIFTQATVKGGTEEYTGVGNEKIIFRNPGNGSLAAGLYVARRVPVTQTVSLPYFSSNTYVWGRGANATTGYSGANPNYQLGYCQVASSDKYSAKLRTWVYYVVSDESGHPINRYYPCAPSEVVFAYTTLGIPGTPPVTPLSVTITGPTYSGSNASWSANASGGNRVYSYAWTIDYGDGRGYQPFSSNSSIASAYVSSYLHVNVVVTSAGQTASADSYAMPSSGGRQLRVYPNPAQEYLVVENTPMTEAKLAATNSSPPISEYTIRVFDQYGTLQRTASTKEGYLRLPTSDLPTGTYYLQASQGKTTSKLQIVIQH